MSRFGERTAGMARPLRVAVWGGVLSLVAAMAPLLLLAPPAHATTNAVIESVSESLVDVSEQSATITFTLKVNHWPTLTPNLSQASVTLIRPDGSRTGRFTAYPPYGSTQTSLEVKAFINKGEQHGAWGVEATATRVGGLTGQHTSSTVVVLNGGLYMDQGTYAIALADPSSVPSGLSSSDWGITRTATRTGGSITPNVPVTYEYQWYSSSSSSNNAMRQPVAGATGATFTPDARLGDHYLWRAMRAVPLSGSLLPSNWVYSERGFASKRQVKHNAATTEPVFGADSYTVPAVTGIEWHATNAEGALSLIAAGTHPSPGRNTTVRMVAQTGYAISKAGETFLLPSLTFSRDYRRVITLRGEYNHPNPADYFFNESSYEVWTREHPDVDFYLNGSAEKMVPGHYYSVTRSVSIKAVLKDSVFTRLSGSDTFYGNFPVKIVTPEAVTFDTYRGTFVVPQVDGVHYYLGDTPVRSGTHTVRKQVEITARSPHPSYELQGTTSWSADLREVFRPSAPWLDRNELRLTIYDYDEESLTWTLDGEVVAPGDHDVRGDVRASVAVKDPETQVIAGQNSWTYDANYEEVTTVPVTSDQTDASYRLPYVKEVEYRVNGKKVEPGTHFHPERTVFTVTLVPAATRYKLVGQTVFTVDLRQLLYPSMPTFDREKRSVTIPSGGLVSYFIDGVAVETGEHLIDSTVEVTVEPKDPTTNRIADESSWTFDGGVVSLPPQEPGQNVEAGTYSIPATAGVEYLVDGRVVAPGEHVARTVVEISARATVRRYKLVGTSSWRLDLRAEIASRDPSFDADAQRVTIHTDGAASLIWKIDGAVAAPGAHAATGAVRVTAEVKDGTTQRLAGSGSWTFDGSVVQVTPTAPTWDVAAGTYSIPSVKGVEYVVDGRVVAAGSHASRAVVVVSARPSAQRYEVTGTAKWEMDLRVVVSPSAPVIDPKAGTVTVPVMPPGVEVRVDGVAVAPGERPVRPGAVVTVVSTDPTIKVGLPTATWTAPAAGGSARPAPVVKKKVKVVKPKFTKRTGRLVLAKTKGVTYKVTVTTPKSKGKKATKKVRTLKPGKRLVLKKRQRVTVRAIAAPNRKVVGKASWKFRR